MRRSSRVACGRLLAAAFFVSSLKESIQSRALLGGDHPAQALTILQPGLFKLRIHLLPEGIKAGTGVAQNAAQLRLLFSSKPQLLRQSRHLRRRIVPVAILIVAAVATIQFIFLVVLLVMAILRFAQEVVKQGLLLRGQNLPDATLVLFPDLAELRIHRVTNGIV